MAGYVKSSDGEEVCFEVEPFPAPVPIAEAAIVGAGAALMFALAGPQLGLPFLAVFGLLYSFAFYLTPSALRHRRPSAFTASAEGVRVGGKMFPAREIHRLVVRNHVSDSDSGLAFGYGPMGVASVMLRQKRLRQLARVSYRVDLESGGRATALAGGLDEVAAFGLMADASAALAGRL